GRNRTGFSTGSVPVHRPSFDLLSFILDGSFFKKTFARTPIFILGGDVGYERHGWFFWIFEDDP
ncbi:hypothetical protein, partial [Paenibacillus eucommiae]|uniref:hypothetical protein n=1 Tax=Paenibacillus eucommiae TaxID=1355755 RepID=UPI001AE7A913